jgi:hypothetical protein
MCLSSFEDTSYRGITNTQFTDLAFAITQTTFDAAHWIFAFNYWAVSWRIELQLKGFPPD